jgi:hypothetical protein
MVFLLVLLRLSELLSLGRVKVFLGGPVAGVEVNISSLLGDVKSIANFCLKCCQVLRTILNNFACNVVFTNFHETIYSFIPCQLKSSVVTTNHQLHRPTTYSPIKK